jgi:hypothetical protein
MKPNALICFLLSLLIFSSCNTSEFTQAANVVSQAFGAKECSVGISANTTNGKSIEIDLTDPAVPEGYENEKVQSTAALILYRNLPKEVLGEYGQIDVTVRRAGTSESRSYPMDVLLRADQAVLNATSFLDWDVENGIAEVSPVVDTEFINDSMLHVVRKAFMQLDSVGGKPNKKIVTGFRADRFKETGESITVVWAETQRISSVDDYTFYVRSSNGKVVFLGVN